MHKNMPATTWQAWVHVFNYFTCLLDRGGSHITRFSIPVFNSVGTIKCIEVVYYA